VHRAVRFLVPVLFLAIILSGCAHAVSSVKEPITATNKPNPSARDQVPDREASADEMIADLLLIRPLGIVSTVMGTAFFIVSLPFSAAGGNTKAAFQNLVVDPAKFTFNRPLGKLEY
jgi:hypothetical protein